MLETTLFSVFLIIVSGCLLWHHRESLRELSESEIEPEHADFVRRQLRRRIQASLMVGIVGVAIYMSHWVEDPVVELAYWSAVLLIVFWICLLALADYLHSRSYFGQLREKQMLEHARLHAELERLKSSDRNGDR